MVLTEKEKHGIAELLARMGTSDLSSLAQTVTSRLILPETTSEAIEAIILHSERSVDLLKRRKVKKEFLFKYLHDKRVTGVEPSQDKNVIVGHVLQLWGSQDSPPLSNRHLGLSLVPAALEEDSLPEAPAPSRNTSYSSLCSLDLNGHSASSALNGGGHASSGSGHAHNHPANLGLILNRRHSSSSVNLASELRRSDSNLSFMDAAEQDGGGGDGPTLSFSAPSAGAAERLGGVLPGAVAATPGPGANGLISPSINQTQAQDLADTFVKWFYEMLNGLTSGGVHGDAFLPDHFWPDASARISLQPATSGAAPAEEVSVHESGKGVFQALLDVVQRYRLTYNPNLCSDGVRGAVDPHGLVVVSACGTLHNGPSCCGTFHQQFGLIRDPFQSNNWKIKFTHARLVSRDGGSAGELPPRLENCPASSASSSAMALS